MGGAWSAARAPRWIRFPRSPRSNGRSEDRPIHRCSSSEEGKWCCRRCAPHDSPRREDDAPPPPKRRKKGAGAKCTDVKKTKHPKPHPDRKFKAKIAERRIFLDQALADALGAENHEEADKVRLQIADETAGLEDKAEAEKEKIRNS